MPHSLFVVLKVSAIAAGRSGNARAGALKQAAVGGKPARMHSLAEMRAVNASLIRPLGDQFAMMNYAAADGRPVDEYQKGDIRCCTTDNGQTIRKLWRDGRVYPEIRENDPVPRTLRFIADEGSKGWSWMSFLIQSNKTRLRAALEGDPPHR